MSDTLKKVKSGEPLKIPVVTFNTFVDAARDFRCSGIALVKNASGLDRGRFNILGRPSPTGSAA